MMKQQKKVFGRETAGPNTMTHVVARQLRDQLKSAVDRNDAQKEAERNELAAKLAQLQKEVKEVVNALKLQTVSNQADVKHLFAKQASMEFIWAEESEQDTNEV